MSAPLVSIVLPVRDGAAYLSGAIEALLEQTLGDFELVCVDDASSDATPQILRAHARRDPRLAILTNANRRGLPASLNIGFARARGALHTWMSHDNLARPQMLERLVAALRAAPHSAIAYGGYAEIDEQGEASGNQPAQPASHLLLANVVGAAFLYRSQVWAALGGYDEALEGVEDYDFWLRARRRFAFTRVEEDVLRYRLHPASLSATRAADIARLHDELLEREIPREGDARAEAIAWLELMRLRRDPRRARYFARALARDPILTLRSSAANVRWLRAALAGRGEKP